MANYTFWSRSGSCSKTLCFKTWKLFRYLYVCVTDAISLPSCFLLVPLFDVCLSVRSVGLSLFSLREDQGFRLISEQVSHHPPVSAFHAEGLAQDFLFHGSIYPKLKFWGKSVEAEPKGTITLELLKWVTSCWRLRLIFCERSQARSHQSPWVYVCRASGVGLFLYQAGSRDLISDQRALGLLGNWLVTCWDADCVWVCSSQAQRGIHMVKSFLLCTQCHCGQTVDWAIRHCRDRQPQVDQTDLLSFGFFLKHTLMPLWFLCTNSCCNFQRKTDNGN